MVQTKSSTKWWIIAGGACAVAGIAALWSAGSSARSPDQSTVQEERRVAGAYRPDRARRARAGANGGSAGAEDALSPELEARLRAAAYVSSVPAAAPPGAPPPPLPPPGPLSPEAMAQRQQALVGWTRQVQQLLDECVARPAAERRPVMLNVVFAPAPGAPQLSPAMVSIPPADLRRLWRDTDPDELQGCLERVRTLALSVPVAPAAAQAPAPSPETLIVQL